MNRFQSWTATETNEGGAFDRLRRNLSLGQSTSTDGTSSSGLNARALDWNDVDGFRVDGDRERQWDFVCGSDLVYSAEGADALARCLAQILSHMKAPAVGGDVTSSEGRIAIAQTCGRWGGHGFDEAPPSPCGNCKASMISLKFTSGMHKVTLIQSGKSA